MPDAAKAPYIAKEQANSVQYKIDKANYSKFNHQYLSLNYS